MSENEFSDDLQELEELVAEYKGKEIARKDTSEYEAVTKHLATEDGKETSSKNVNKAKSTKAPLGKKRAKNFKNKARGSTEVPMDRILFGHKAQLIKNMARAVGECEEEQSSELDRDDGIVKDVTGSLAETGQEAKKRKPVWADEDDEIQVADKRRNKKRLQCISYVRGDKSYKEYLTARFQRCIAQPKWASLEHKKKTDFDSDDDEVLQTVGFLAKPSESVLMPQHIGIKRLNDLNRATRAEGAIFSVEFHPTSTAALVAGNSGNATIYAVDGKMNEKLHSISFKDYPIRCAKISPCGTKAIFGSIKNYYYSYDLLDAQETRYRLPREITRFENFQLSPCGRYIAVTGRSGSLHLFDAKTNELIHTFTQEHMIRALRFTADSSRIITSTKTNTINIFSIRQERLEHIFMDDGCIEGSCIDLSPNQRLLATGSMEGVVNVYDFDKVQVETAPKPEKIFYNLTTAISDVKFNHSSELLSFNSKQLGGAVRLAHFPTATVYANFPAVKTDIGMVRLAEFSPTSGYLALGTLASAVRLFRLKHFKTY